ncbi:hypothetical protein JCM3765_004907 [Sporobolomyces pararoseus]
MPATRSLKPLLKFTVLFCFIFVLYRSFVQPRFASPTTTSETSTYPVPQKGNRVAGGGNGEKKGINWGRESDSGVKAGGAPVGGGRDDEGIAVGFRPKPQQQFNEYDEPKKPIRQQLEKDRLQQKKKIEQVAKQVPNQVPNWVVAKEIERVEDNGAKVPVGKKKGGDAEETFKKELEKMKERKEQKLSGGRKKLNNDDDEEEQDNPPPRTVPKGGDDAIAAEGNRKVYHLVDEDDELDAAQRGDSDARLALTGQRKKGPLIQVGGAGNAAGEKVAGAAGAGAGAGAAGAAAEAVKAKGKDKWKGKGWDQRFKKQGGEKDKEEEQESTAEGEEKREAVDKAADLIDSKKQRQIEDEEQSATADQLLVQHPLVARFLKQDISHNGRGSPHERSQVTFVSSDDEDVSPGRKPKEDDDSVLPLTPPSPERHNLTVCALVPNEQRFLPEWILYHSLLGVSRFALYDTSLPGAFGGEEIDQLADSMREEGGGGENAPTVEELKAQVAVSNAGREGLDEKGMIRRERVRGLEEWIDKDRVKMFYMKFKNPRASHDVHALMLENCVERFGATSNWLAHLDVDEFLSLSTPLYGTDEPHSVQASSSTPNTADHVYPLHDLLASPALDAALCLPVPELNYRNLGIKELKRSQGVLETQVHRDVLGEVKESSRSFEERGSLPQKTLIHTGFSSEPGVAFSGPHSCTIDDLEDAIRDSQGNILASRDGLYHSQNLPIEPLAIAHYVQRDLLDCHSKLSSVADPLSLLPKGRGSISCEAHYLPSAAELASDTWRNDPANEDLKKVPPLGSVLEDRRMATSWAARSAKVIGDAWRKSQERGMRKLSKSEREKLVSRVRHKVEILSY